MLRFWVSILEQSIQDYHIELLHIKVWTTVDDANFTSEVKQSEMTSGMNKCQTRICRVSIALGNLYIEGISDSLLRNFYMIDLKIGDPVMCL